MGRAEIQNEDRWAEIEDGWAEIGRDPRLASVLASVRRVSGLPVAEDQPIAFAPRRGFAAPHLAPAGDARPEAPHDDAPATIAPAATAPTRRPRRPVRGGLTRDLALAAAVALLLHLAVVLTLGGGATVLRAALEDGLPTLELGGLDVSLQEVVPSG